MKLSDEIINSLSLNLREKIRNIKGENIEEIRLRINKPLIINGNQRDYFYNEKNKNLDMNMDNAYVVTKEDIEQTFQIICKYSIHSFMDDIKKGFITLRGGHRVGIVGKAIVEEKTTNDQKLGLKATIAKCLKYKSAMLIELKNSKTVAGLFFINGEALGIKPKYVKKMHKIDPITNNKLKHKGYKYIQL